MQIFSGNPDWKTVKKGGLYHGGVRTMSSLNTAKVLCDSLSTLTFAENPKIIIDNADASEYVEKVLADNCLFYRMAEILSKAYALGGCFLRPFISENKIIIDCVFGDNFIPISWDNFKITEGCFIWSFTKNGVKYSLFERHTLQDGVPTIENTLFEMENDSFSPCELSEFFPDLKASTSYNGFYNQPVFSHFKPAGSNNKFSDLPLGLSAFENSIDTLKALDIAFDSLSREFILGKKRIIVPSSCVQTVVDINTGKQQKYFDSDDEAYVALKCDEERDLKITDNTIELRIDEHISAINALLNILCFQTGLSSGTFSFDTHSSAKTATEIISRDNKTASTIKANKNALTNTLVSLAKSIIILGSYLGDLPDDIADETSISVAWPDSIVTDSNTVIDNNIRLVNSGLKSKTSAITDINKCDKTYAEEEYNRILAENKPQANSDF